MIRKLSEGVFTIHNSPVASPWVLVDHDDESRVLRESMAETEDKLRRAVERDTPPLETYEEFDRF